MTLTRSGQLFLGPQLGLGVPGVSGVVRAGWIDQASTPCPGQLGAFVGGPSLTGSGYVPLFGVTGPAAGETWGNEGSTRRKALGTEFGWGVGLGRYAGVTQSYNFHLVHLPLGW